VKESAVRNGLSVFVPLLTVGSLALPFWWMPPVHVWIILPVVWGTSLVLLSQLWRRHWDEEADQRELRLRAPDRPRQALTRIEESIPTPQSEASTGETWPPPKNAQKY
jgi:hypothetical protein